MTFKILKSHLPPDFENLLAEYHEAKLKHRFTENEAAPSAIPEIANCVIRIPGSPTSVDDFILDYEIIDDTPAPPSLDTRKQDLMAKVNSTEIELNNTISPPGKRRLEALQQQELISAGTTRELKPEEQQQLQDSDDKNTRLMAIYRRVAELHAEIEDLTEDNIDSWVMSPLE